MSNMDNRITAVDTRHEILTAVRGKEAAYSSSRLQPIDN